jgi:probable rRNA maturation factor
MEQDSELARINFPADAPHYVCELVVDEDGRWLEPGVVQLVEQAAVATMRYACGNKLCSVTVALSSDDEVARLNATFRGKPGPTNVLSFPALQASHVMPTSALGDVILAYETVAMEAKAEGKTLAHHAAHLAVHGVLHLTGYDHESDAAAEQMEDAERQILSSFGIADPYAVFAGNAARH